MFVKETQTCHYVLHIATPRLCGEPGFRSHRDAHEEAYIRCREVVSPEQFAAADRTLPDAPHPFKRPARPPKAVIAPAPAEEAKKDEGAKAGKHSDVNEVIRHALEKLVAGGDLKAGEITIIEDGDDEVLIEFLNYGDDEVQSLQELLSSSGMDMIREKLNEKGVWVQSEEEDSADEKREEQDPYVRDEL